MKLIFLYGLPATGKYTVAKELAAITGYKLFHNHQVVDMLLSVFDFGTEPFVALREDIWLSIFEEAATAEIPALIFTFNPENTVSPAFIPNIIEALTQTGSNVDFIELQCPLNELKSRMDSPARQQFRKLTSVPLFEQLHADGVFDTSHMPTPRLTIDTSTCTPIEAADQIAQALQLPRTNSHTAPTI
jgi:chloramphenicol 3-O-phosphotransferase